MLTVNSKILIVGDMVILPTEFMIKNHVKVTPLNYSLIFCVVTHIYNYPGTYMVGKI